MTYTLGIDLSAWDDLDETPQRPDLQKAWNKGARFAFVKLSQNTWKDPDFDYYWSEAKRIGFLRGAYHLHEYRPEKAPASATRQAEAFCSYLPKDDPGELPPAYDLEKPNATWPELPNRTTCLDWCGLFFKMIEDRIGPYYKQPAVLYTNKATILYKLAPVPTWLRAHPLWYSAPVVPANGMTPEQFIAAGLATPRVVPAHWPEWKFWQYSWLGDGPAFGTEAKAIDLNYFNGSLDDLRKWAGVDVTPAPPALTLEQRVERLEKLLNIA